VIELGWVDAARGGEFPQHAKLGGCELEMIPDGLDPVAATAEGYPGSSKQYYLLQELPPL
jgi:hypothetical protein